MSNNTILRSILQFKKKYMRTSRPALHDMDRKLAKYLDFQGGFFIEAGANDGYYQSNTYFLEKKRGWHGILVEGIPELYERCIKSRTGSMVHNCVLVSNAYTQPTATMHFADLMSVVEEVAGSEEELREHLEHSANIQFLDTSYSISVPARTLESILDETGDLPEIDLFSLDVEGYELQVLEGLNIAKYAPRFILVELNSFDAVNTLLVTRYDLVEQFSHHDYLYERKQGVSPLKPERLD